MFRFEKPPAKEPVKSDTDKEVLSENVEISSTAVPKEDGEATVTPSKDIARCVDASPSTAELHMTQNMTALREGRSLRQLIIDNGSTTFYLVTALIPNFDPNSPQANSSSVNVPLRIPPDCNLDLEGFYRKKEEFEFQGELVALREDGSIAASVFVDDMTVPIFKYILVRKAFFHSCFFF